MSNMKDNRHISLRVMILALFMFQLLQALYPQKLIKSSGKAQVRMEMNMTTEQAYQEARLQAMIDAIQNAFGTYVEQQTDMSIMDGKEAFNIIAGTKVRGDWIETLDERFTEDLKVENTKFGKQNVKYITCNIRGKVRKTLPKAEIDYEVLNCPELLCRTTNFLNDEQLYLYFRSPVDGYLSVFIEVDDVVYRVLPYANMEPAHRNGVRVKADETYLFFSEEHNRFTQSAVDELLMFTNKKLEYNTLHVVFSEEKFIKPLLNEKKRMGDRELPKSLELSRYTSWLSGNRAALPTFQERKVSLSIKPNP